MVSTYLAARFGDRFCHPSRIALAARSAIALLTTSLPAVAGVVTSSELVCANQSLSLAPGASPIIMGVNDGLWIAVVGAGVSSELTPVALDDLAKSGKLFVSCVWRLQKVCLCCSSNSVVV